MLDRCDQKARAEFKGDSRIFSRISKELELIEGCAVSSVGIQLIAFPQSRRRRPADLQRSVALLESGNLP